MTDFLERMVALMDRFIEDDDKPAAARMRRIWKRGLQKIDKPTAMGYYTYRYPYGSTKAQQQKRGGRFRHAMLDPEAIRYQWKNSKKYGWSYRSMMRRKGRGDNYQGNLAHLVEDGGWNWRARTMNKGRKIRRRAFQMNETAARLLVIQGVKERFR